MPKIERGEALGFLNIHSVAKFLKNEGGPLGEKSKCRKRTKMGDPLVSSVIVCYAGNFFGSVPWAKRSNLKFCRTFGRTILVTSGVSKKFF